VPAYRRSGIGKGPSLHIAGFHGCGVHFFKVDYPGRGDPSYDLGHPVRPFGQQIPEAFPEGDLPDTPGNGLPAAPLQIDVVGILKGQDSPFKQIHSQSNASTRGDDVKSKLVG
jgi:hypothetical protein